MSHISTYKTKIKDVNQFLNICESRGYKVNRTKHIVKQFGRNQVDCVSSVLLTGWRYEIAITSEGELKYDHFGSKPNTFDLLGQTIQEYNESMVMANIPYDQIQSYHTSYLQDGSKQIIIEY